MVAQRNCLWIIFCCSLLNGTWIPQKTLRWDCVRDILIFVSSCFFTGLLLSSPLLSLPESSCPLLPFLFESFTFLVVFWASEDAFGHGLLPPLPRICVSMESKTPSTPPMPFLHALLQIEESVRWPGPYGKHKVSYLPSITHGWGNNSFFPPSSSSTISPSGHFFFIYPWQWAQMWEPFCFSPGKK